MLIGSAGCGKTVLINEKLAQLDENYLVANVPFNYYYTAEMLQKILEKPLEKKAGKNYGPPGNKKLVYFIDDINMPEVDLYGTVGPHTLIRQHLDYNHWYYKYMFRSSHFSLLVFGHFWRQRYAKLRQYQVIFVYILQGKMGRGKNGKKIMKLK